MKEWQTAWGAIETVTEIEVEPATTVDLSWRATPKSRVSLTSPDAGYVRTVYDPISDPLTGRVQEHPWTLARDATDVAHIHWPEWCFGYGTSLDDHTRIAARLRRQGTKIVWTQHNLTPHLDEPDVYDPIYQVWADACDLAIHHSHWGLEQVTARYRFRDGCRHEVIPHPHFGPAMTPAAHTSRDDAAERLGLRTGADAPALRIGVIGAPRKEKDLGLVVEAVRASGRDDIELVLWSLSFADSFGPDARIVTNVYDNVDRERYDLQLAACDAIALPFTRHTMLGTGTASDLVAAGVPGLVSDWPYLTEHLEGLGIPMGETTPSWTAAIDRLTTDRLSEAAAHAPALRDRYDPTRIGLSTARAIEALGIMAPSWR
jgi:glycosyltransferase involved in cell wall biosynthesis